MLPPRFIFAFAVLLFTVSAFAADAAISVQDATGALQTPLADHGQKATALVFLMRDCPIGNSYAPEIGRIVKEYEPGGVKFFAVYPGETPARISRHLKEYQLPLTGLCDEAGKLAEAAGATVAPEAAVFSPAGELLYRGRIDDRAVRLGAVRAEPRRRDLRLALDAILAGRAVGKRFTKVIGCYLPKPETKPAAGASSP